MTDERTEGTSRADGPSEPRPAVPVRPPLRQRATASTAGWVRSVWYRFQRLFGLDSCPIDQGPGAWLHPNPPSAAGRAHHSSEKGPAGEAHGVRSGRGTPP